MSFSINKLLTVILVIAAVGMVLMFWFKVDITKYFEFLLDFDANKEDKVIEGVVTGDTDDDVVKFSGKEDDEFFCIENAFWVDSDKKVILNGEEIKPENIFVALEIVNIDECEGAEIIFEKNVPKGITKQALSKSILLGMKGEGDNYYVDYEVFDVGRGIDPLKKGEYSFNVVDASGNIISEGSKIKVNKWSLW